MLIVVAPGQGSQKPGMFSDWLELPGVAGRLDDFGQVAGLDLRRLGSTADAAKIKDTAITQPLVVAAALLAAEQLPLAGSGPVAGHSVGELAAAALAGVFPAAAAVALAAVRGAAMGRACALAPTGMSAMVGGDPDDVLAGLADRDLVGANRNGGGQIVVAGPLQALAELAADPPAGARVIPLAVAGAFHTEYMSTAAPELARALAEVPVTDPDRPLLSNSDGATVDSGARFAELLVQQITRPVRWDLCQATFTRLGVTGILELPPAGALIGLARRELPGVATLAVKGPADLDRAIQFIHEHTEAAA